MVFSSATFAALFFPLVFVLYFAFQDYKVRNGILLGFSLLFYAWGEPKWVFIMLLTVTVNYLSGRIIGSTQKQNLRTAAMIVGVALSLVFLFYFKYFGFFTDIFTGLFGLENTFQKPQLPIGLSFFTFQVITYTVDV